MKRNIQKGLTPGASKVAAKTKTATLKPGQFMAFGSQLKKPVKRTVKSATAPATVGTSNFGGMAFANFSRPANTPSAKSESVSVMNAGADKAGVYRTAEQISLYKKGTMQGNSFRNSMKLPGGETGKVAASAVRPSATPKYAKPAAKRRAAKAVKRK